MSTLARSSHGEPGDTIYSLPFYVRLVVLT